MNAIPPGGLVPEEPLTRPSTARRGAKAAAGADKVSLMIALEDEAEDSARGEVMLEDAEKGQHEPPVEQAGAMAANAPLGSQEQDPEGGAAHAAEAAGSENPSAGRRDSGTPPEPRRATAEEITPYAPTSGQMAGEALGDTPTVPPAAMSQQAPSPADATMRRGNMPPPHEAHSEPHPAHRNPATEAWQEPAQGAGTGGTHRPGTQRQDQDRPSPWVGGRPASQATPPGQATPEGWDRPAPPPRLAPRTASRSAVDFGMPVQLSGIEVTLSVEIGSHRLSLRDLLSVEPGQLVPLDRMTSEPVDILVNGKPFARGEVVAIGDRFGVRLTELVDSSDAG